MADIQINFVTDGLERAAKILKDMKADAGNVSFGSEGNNEVLKQVIEDVKKLKAAKTELNKVQKVENEASEKTNIQQKTYSDLLKQVEKAEAKLAIANSEKAKQLLEIQSKQAKVTAEIKAAIKAEKDESDSINSLRAQIIKLTQARNQYSTATKHGREQIDRINKQIEKHTETIRKNADAALKQKMNIGNYGSALSALPGPIGQAASSATRLGTTLKAVFTNPILLTVTALAAAIYSVGKAFLSTDSGATKYEAVMQQLKTTWSVYLQFISNIGKYDKDVIKHFKEAKEAANDYAYAMDALNDSAINQISWIAQQKRSVAELQNVYSDQTKSIDDRIKAAEEAQNIIKNITAFETKQAKDAYEERIDLIAAEFDINKKTLNNFIQANDETAQKILKIDKEMYRARNDMGDDEQKNLEELYAKKDEIIKASEKEQRRMITMLSGLYVQKDKEQVKSAKDKTDAQIQLDKEYDDAYLQILEQERADLQKKLDDDLKAYNDKIEAQKKLDQEYDDAYIQLLEQERAEEQKKYDESVAAAKQAEQKKEQGKAEIRQAAFNLAFALTDLMLAKNTSAMNAELIAAEGNEKKQDEIRKKYAKKEQAISISQAIIAGAESVANVWSKWAAVPPVAAALSALALATVGIQIATIKAQKFAKGGEIDYGRLHSEGGTLIEAEKGEYVINRKSTSKYKGLIEGINQDDQMKILASLHMDRRVEGGFKQDEYTKKLYELMKDKEVGYETPEFFVIHKGTKTIKLKKH